MFDLLIQGGRVVDPGAGLVGMYDIAINRDRIVAVDRGISREAAWRVIDAGGQIVTPGLVDLHTHAFHRGTYWGINPDPIAARTGVTTWLDVGSAGAYNWLAFRDFIIAHAQVRLYGLLNISSIGLTAPDWELANPKYCDVDICSQMIGLHRDKLLGVKVRVDASTTSGSGLIGLERAVMAAEQVGLPIMTHISSGPPALADILDRLRPGDILTHCCTGRSNKLIDDQGFLLQVAHAARERGILMDVGHGAGSFSFEAAERMLAEGFVPDVISSDIHQLAAHGPCFDLPTCLSKFMAMGLSLEEVVLRATARPAAIMGLAGQVGTLQPGALADLALFRLHHGRFPLYDIFMHERIGTALLENTLTLIGGRELRRLPDDAPMPWIGLTEDQQALIDRGHTPTQLIQPPGSCC
ncbi:MAG: amidohydrolase/deacetylase family metallohydrolase [Roseiflexaceae bacterium]